MLQMTSIALDMPKRFCGCSVFFILKIS